MQTRSLGPSCWIFLGNGGDHNDTDDDITLEMMVWFVIVWVIRVIVLVIVIDIMSDRRASVQEILWS